MLKSDIIAKMLEKRDADDPLVIIPLLPRRGEDASPTDTDIELVRKSGSASVDLRLGCWFCTLRETRLCALDVARESEPSQRDEPSQKEAALTKRHFVRFGEAFVLHPRSFVLGVTLQWIRLPRNVGGYVTSRSSWGRRGLIVATAVGVHPGFAGCLTLELSNVGEIPVKLYPGMEICQFFLHRVTSKSREVDRSRFIGNRRPSLGKIKPDRYFELLAQPRQSANPVPQDNPSHLQLPFGTQ